MQEYYTKRISNCQNNTTHHGHKSNRKKLNISGGVTDVAKQSLMAAGSGLLKAKGVGATPGQVIAAPELSNNLDQDRKALTDFNQALLDGATPAEAYADNLTNVSKAAQEAARQSNGLPVDIDKYANAQTAASMATKVSTGSMIAQSVASAALTGAISMGVTLAVNGLVMGLDYLAHAHERAVEAAKADFRLRTSDDRCAVGKASSASTRSFNAHRKQRLRQSKRMTQTLFPVAGGQNAKRTKKGVD